MSSYLTTPDWIVIAAYLAGMLSLAIFLGRKQRSRSDYYLGGNGLPSWALATSVVATQCSTNSLLGAPAFVGFVAAGGMLWSERPPGTRPDVQTFEAMEQRATARTTSPRRAKSSRS